MNVLYIFIAVLILNGILNIHVSKKKTSFLNNTYPINKYKTINIKRHYRKIQNRNNKLYVSLFDEYDEKCIKALIMAREVAKNDNESEILLKHLLIAIIRIDSNLVQNILKNFNISLTNFLDKFHIAINKISKSYNNNNNGDNNIYEQSESIQNNINEQEKNISLTNDQMDMKNILNEQEENQVTNGNQNENDNLNENEKLLNDFINKHLKDMEEKINILKNLNNQEDNSSLDDINNKDYTINDISSSNHTTKENNNNNNNNNNNDDDDNRINVNNLDTNNNSDNLSNNIPNNVSQNIQHNHIDKINNNGTHNKMNQDLLRNPNFDIKFSENCKLVLHNAVLEAKKKRKMFVNIVDILLSVINIAQEKKHSDFLKYLEELNININDLKSILLSYDEKNYDGNNIYDTNVNNTNYNTYNRNIPFNNNNNNNNNNSMSNKGYNNQRLNNNEQANHIINSLNNEYLNNGRDYKYNEDHPFSSNNKFLNPSASSPSSISFMKDCLIDMVHEAQEKGDDHFFGRKKEIKRIIEILGRKKKSNPLLIGESGVGKTAIIEHLSYLILKDNVPYHLKNCRIFQLNLGNIVAGTKYRGEFEEKMKHLLSNMNKKKKNILFIDEIHVIVGAGSGEGSLDASNLLKPFLSSDNLQCIGTTTFQEYSKFIENDKALRRRFNCVTINPFTSKETYRLLKKIKYNYEKYHNIYYTDDSLKSIVTLTEDYLPTANFPDKAIDILDEAGVYQKIKYEKFMKQKLRNERLNKIRIHMNNQQNSNYNNNSNNNNYISNEEQHIYNNNHYYNNNDVINQQTELSNEEDIHKFNYDDTIKKDIDENNNVNTDINGNLLINNNESLQNNTYDDETRNLIENVHMKYVTSDVIENIVSKKSSITYIKKNKKEEEKILKLKEKLNKIIIGQEKVIDILSKYLFKAITNIKDPNKPIGTLLLCGSSGVGKTLCAQVISKYLFNEDNLIVINMSEYIDKHSVSKLFGSYPGYVGYKEGGELTESVKKKPFSIILFDEIEKAHSEVLHVLLQILDNGLLTDSKGNKVSFKNTFIFMTTNVGSDIITDYFKLYNNNYSNLGFKYYIKKKKNASDINESKQNEEQLVYTSNGNIENEQNKKYVDHTKQNEENNHESTISDTHTTDPKYNNNNNNNNNTSPNINISNNNNDDHFDIFEEKLRTNKWYDELKPDIEEELKKKFLPEFLNRIDEKIIFRQFLKRDIINILQNMIDDLKKRIKKRKNINLVIDKNVINYICSDENNIYDMNFGARSIRRALYKYIEDPIAAFLISNIHEPNDSIYVQLTNDKQIKVQLIKAPVQQLSS
ncbi:ATP-dependent Clp protease, putative [Plasmodium sp. gorilla clade G2]|uniref:ATP-dependent Clp protease, putative n=1 Tax=Plasmodium sp. gorilla clade G2 TaxID=880535 RepID=UPI000D2127A4|nr:ATP-dependent Clp protease, putative [Plasmodium sp. gorilla clade G2]SOV18645.1 ATP-dependent Clp protease, putative [Plasmodium sp. gorilla clade G2]